MQISKSLILIASTFKKYSILCLKDVADTVEDLEFLVNYRKWVQEMTGAELIIMS